MSSGETSFVNDFVDFLQQNSQPESEEGIYSKQTLLKDYAFFVEKRAEKENQLSFPTLLLRLKEQKLFKSHERDFVKLINEKVSKITQDGMFNIPKFASNCRFFLTEIDSYEILTQSVETSLLPIPTNLEDSFNEAFDNAEQVVLLINVQFSKRLQGYVTMDTRVTEMEEIGGDWPNASTENRFCYVSWEFVGDTKMPKEEDGKPEVKAQAARQSVIPSFYFERQNKAGCVEFKSPESTTQEEFNTCHRTDLQQEKRLILSSRSPNRNTVFLPDHDYTASEEELSEPAEGFRRRSLDKREAAQHYDMPPRKTGVVVKFSQQKGYGFIRPDYDFGSNRQLPDIFVHRTSIVSSSKIPNLRVGQKTEYDVTLDPRTGKPHAVNVTGPCRIPLDEMKASKMECWDQHVPPNRQNFEPNNPNWNANSNSQYSEKPRRKGWNNQDQILPKDMSMTVTIDNDATPRYKRSAPWKPGYEDYNASSHAGAQNFDQRTYAYHDNNAYAKRNARPEEYRNFMVTSPTRFNDPSGERGYNPYKDAEYDSYQRQREYWRYQNNNYDYRQQQNFDSRYQNRQQNYQNQNW